MQPNDEAFGFHVNRVAAVLNGVNPIPLTIGGLTIQNNLSVGGTTTLTGTLTLIGNTTIGGTLGVTGLTTLSGGLAVTNITGPITINPGGLTVSTGGITVGGTPNPVLSFAANTTAVILGGTVGLNINDSSGSFVNLGITQAGVVTLRNNLTVPTILLTTTGYIGFKSVATGTNTGWAIIATGTSVTFREESLAMTGLTIADTGSTPLIGFYGHAAVAQPAAPVTLADVIAVIRGNGLSA